MFWDQRPVEANSTGGQGSRRAAAPSGDDDDDDDDLGSSYAHSIHHDGRVCIYVRSDLNFITINLSQFCDEINI